MNFKSIAILSGVLAAGVASAQAITIDDFSTGNASIDITGTNNTGYGFQAGSMIGGDRWTELFIGPTNPFGISFSIDVNTGRLSVSSESGVDGRARIGYGYSDTGTGPAFQDLNASMGNNDRFVVDFIYSDQPLQATMSIRSGGVTSMVTKMINPSVVPFQQTWLFSEFTGVSFADVDQVYLELDTAASGDVTIDAIRAVPEPMTMGLLALGLAGVAARKRRK